MVSSAAKKVHSKTPRMRLFMLASSASTHFGSTQVGTCHSLFSISMRRRAAQTVPSYKRQLLQPRATGRLSVPQGYRRRLCVTEAPCALSSLKLSFPTVTGKRGNSFFYILVQRANQSQRGASVVQLAITVVYPVARIRVRCCVRILRHAVEGQRLHRL